MSDHLSLDVVNAETGEEKTITFVNAEEMAEILETIGWKNPTIEEAIDHIRKALSSELSGPTA